MDLKKIVFVVGPTAVGKTPIAFLLAKEIRGEIISCDAMQIYKEINCISNKPSFVLTKDIPHHLLNIVSISREFDVVLYRKKALVAIRRIHKKNKIPVIVGGSGFYMSVLLDGIFRGAEKNERIRRKLEKEAEKKGNLFLYERLQQVDPQAALKIHPNDRKRVVRALEVFMMSKKAISKLQKKRQGLWGKFDIKIFALHRERRELYELIDRRVEKMFEEGAVNEISSLSKRKWSKTSESIIGVKEIKGFLRGEYSLEQVKYLIKLKTRHYAKRQLTWFRKEKRLDWVLIKHSDVPSEIVLRIIKRMGG